MDLLPEANATTICVALAAIGLAKPVYLGVKQTVIFLSSLSTSKKHHRIGKYNDLQADDSAEGRDADYTTLVDSYYDLATEFYEWGWGTSFHFATRFRDETFRQSILRHEYYLAGKLGVNKGAKILDCGESLGVLGVWLSSAHHPTITPPVTSNPTNDRARLRCRRSGPQHPPLHLGGCDGADPQPVPG
mmetsp:Transcript_64225/g.177626  ORF Transcript_64225/g.177626 Transcript_64225/m.177626 type:complete len:189 (+) Transcript_64225:157-723(+)